MSFLSQKRGLGVGLPKKIAWNLQKSNMNVDSKPSVVWPATEIYVEEAVEALKAGKVIAVPTDTLYGFACDAWYVILMGDVCFSVLSSSNLLTLYLKLDFLA